MSKTNEQHEKEVVVNHIPDSIKTCTTCSRACLFIPGDCLNNDYKFWLPKTDNKSPCAKINHDVLFCEHWDNYTGPLLDRVAKAVQAITQLGETEEETDNAIVSLLRAMKFVAMSHWIHGAKHESEAR